MTNDAEAIQKRHTRIHDLSIKIVLDWAETTKSESGPDVAKLDRDRLLKKIFRNYRNGRGIRLSKFGFDILSKKFASYPSAIPETKVVARTHLFLDHNANLPYYLVESTEEIKIVLFEQIMAAILKMCDQDINSLPDQWG